MNGQRLLKAQDKIPCGSEYNCIRNSLERNPPSNGEFGPKSRVGHKVRTQKPVVTSRKLESANTSRTDHISSRFQYVSMDQWLYFEALAL